jgi:hypothetical protein
MRFRTWILKENSLNANFPEVLSQVNKADSVPASAEVVRTGLQPQVQSNEIPTAAKDEQDQIQAIDAAIQNVESKINNNGGEKINDFKKIWKKLKEKWEHIKLNKKDDLERVDINGLGGTSGDEELSRFMQQNPNTTVNDLNSFNKNLSNLS